jgi:hypothetical protein
LSRKSSSSCMSENYQLVLIGRKEPRRTHFNNVSAKVLGARNTYACSMSMLVSTEQ